jgi:hypothetical protein
MVKQPNGLYAIWSTIVDHFVSVECTAEEALAEEVADKITTITPVVLTRFVATYAANLRTFTLAARLGSGHLTGPKPLRRFANCMEKMPSLSCLE